MQLPSYLLILAISALTTSAIPISDTEAPSSNPEIAARGFLDSITSTVTEAVDDVGKVANIVANFGAMAKSFADCVGSSPFTTCIGPFEACGKDNQAPWDCDDGKLCLSDQKVDVDACLPN